MIRRGDECESPSQAATCEPSARTLASRSGTSSRQMGGLGAADYHCPDGQSAVAIDEMEGRRFDGGGEAVRAACRERDRGQGRSTRRQRGMEGRDDRGCPEAARMGPAADATTAWAPSPALGARSAPIAASLLPFHSSSNERTQPTLRRRLPRPIPGMACLLLPALMMRCRTHGRRPHHRPRPALLDCP